MPALNAHKYINLNYIGGALPTAHFSGVEAVANYFTRWYYLPYSHDSSVVPPNTKIEIFDESIRFFDVFYTYLGIRCAAGIPGFFSEQTYVCSLDSLLYGTPKYTNCFYPLLMCNGNPFIGLMVPAIENMDYRWETKLSLNPRYFNFITKFPKIPYINTMHETIYQYPITIRSFIACNIVGNLSYLHTYNFAYFTQDGGVYESTNSEGNPKIYVDRFSPMTGLTPPGIRVKLTVPEGDTRMVALCVSDGNGNPNFEHLPCFLQAKQDSNASSWEFYSTYIFVFSDDFFDFKELFPHLY